ncbi:arsenate reductase/protein-tyrosine-phosphatase family protein [Corynebacterium glyciniphilum]|uniref:Putative phosphatase n=1 Tax=Corynebacterium glyciniphilum AJ 3170 TaxID=1404245 RepID=X5DUY6_9CORY|nr:HAD hydrolase-like protein [Corynebacterium glyciniphilum]AHW64462.1 Putative phosphatase [Corynebacterium glyciniphilum AJ 3170]
MTDAHEQAGNGSRTLLVDVDGTLVDSYPGIRSSFLHALEDNDVPVPGEDLLRLIAGPPMVDTLRNLGLEGEQLEATVASYRQHYDGGGWLESAPFDGIEDLLRSWKDQGYTLSTATSKSLSSATRLLKHFDLYDYFDVIATASDDGERRAKDAVVAYGLEQLGAPGGPVTPAAEGGPSHRDNLLMIGDRIHDVDGARAYGIRTVLVDWGYGIRDEHRKADYSVADAAELGRLVEEWSDERPHICVVCTGNICRSPMGEIMLRQALGEAGLADDIRLNSCGTDGWHVGEAADPRAVARLRQDGFNGSGHRAAQFGPEHRDADLFLVMTAAHRKALVKQGVPEDRIALFRSFGPAGEKEVEDPYYGGKDGFAEVSRQLAEAIPGVVEWARDRVAARD